MGKGYSIEPPRTMETPDKYYLGFPKSIGRIYDENRATDKMSEDHQLAEALRRNWEEHNQFKMPRKLPYYPDDQTDPAHLYRSEPFPMIPDPNERIKM